MTLIFVLSLEILEPTFQKRTLLEDLLLPVHNNQVFDKHCHVPQLNDVDYPQFDVDNLQFK